MLQVKAG